MIGDIDMADVLPDNLKSIATDFGPVSLSDPVQTKKILDSIKAAGMVPFITPAPDGYVNYWGVRPQDIPPKPKPKPTPPPPPKKGWW